MLNRLFSAAMLAAVGLLCCCSGPRLGENEYILRGTIEGDDLPEKVVLLDITTDPSVGDTVGLKGRSFEFRGMVEEPMVTILQYTTQGGKRRFHVFYLEPGDIRMEIEVGSPEARFKGLSINVEAAEWAALTPAAQESKPGRQLLEMLEFNKISAGIAELTEIGRPGPGLHPAGYRRQAGGAVLDARKVGAAGFLGFVVRQLPRRDPECG